MFVRSSIIFISGSSSFSAGIPFFSRRVFSNSLIEHLATYENQAKLAKESQRIGKHYFIQTPAYIFPLEPHFLFPFFHWLPVKIRVLALQKFNIGWYPRERNFQDAKQKVEEIRIMKLRELKNMFVNGKIIKEKLFGLTKSYIAHD